MPATEINSNLNVSRVAMTCALLGMVFGGSFVISMALPMYMGLAFYIGALSAFHFLEFYWSLWFHPTTTTYQGKPLK
jgi:hypothetical protein